MLEFKARGVRWRFSLMFPAMITILLLWRPDSLAIPCVLASLVHEGGHLLAMMLIGIPPQEFLLGVFGARISVNGGKMRYGQNILVSLSGPLINLVFSTILMLCRCPAFAIVNAVLAGVNLLPAIGLDGGEILYSCLCRFGLGSMAYILVRTMSAIVLVPIAAAGFYIMIAGSGNPSLLVICTYLAVLIFFADKNEKSS